MAGKLALVQMFIVLKLIHCRALEPPQNLTITDPGLLGPLEIHWEATEEHIRLRQQSQCRLRYEVHFFESYRNQWNSIRTPETSFTTLFDLSQEVKVCIYTVMSGPCAGGTLLKSQNCTKVIQQPDRAGVEGLQDLACVFYNSENVVCRWSRTSKMPTEARETFYYWNSEMANPKECPHYIISDGLRSGCNFTGTELPICTDLNLCVNVSSPRPVRAVYTSLQIQNFVKINAAEVRVEAGADRQVSFVWDSPLKTIPGGCVTWEAEDRRETLDGKETLTQMSPQDTAVTLILPDDESVCLRVRSILNFRCANGGLWSDWSPSVCYPEKKLSAPAAEQDVFIPVAVGAVLILALSVWALVIMARLRQVKTKDSALSSSFDNSSAQFLPVENHV